jgi:hypothetical protein
VEGPMEPGLYEQLVTDALRDRLATLSLPRSRATSDRRGPVSLAAAMSA